MDLVGKRNDAFFVWFAVLQAAIDIKPVGLINAHANLKISCSYIFQDLLKDV